MTEQDTHTFAEIKFSDRLWADIEERAEAEGTDPHTFINIICAIAVKS